MTWSRTSKRPEEGDHKHARFAIGAKFVVMEKIHVENVS